MILSKHKKENKMIKVILTLNNDTERFEAKSEDSVVHYTAKKKADLKTSLKRSKKNDYEIVEAFEVKKAPKKPNKAKKTDKKANGYEDRKKYIITHFTDGDLHSKSPKIAAFCKKFDLKISAAGRNLTFEKTLEKMVEEKIIDYVPSSGIYKKLIFEYTKAHKAAMSPDKDEL